MKTFAFEPSYNNFYQLNQNIKINGYEKIITPVNFAISDNGKVSRFNFLDDATGTSKCFYNESGEFHYKSPVIFTSNILVCSLDLFVEIFGAPVPNYIKIDVDGAELDVILGAKKTLRNYSLKSIQIEVDDKKNSASQVIKLILESGFVIESKTNFKNSISNYIFYRK